MATQTDFRVRVPEFTNLTIRNTGFELGNFETTAGAFTIPAATLINGFVHSVPGGNVTWTTDTATNIVAKLNEFTPAVVGVVFSCQLFNDGAGAEVVTLAGGVGVTLNGTTLTLTKGTNDTGMINFYVLSVTSGAEAIEGYVVTGGGGGGGGNTVTAGAVITDNALVRGDGGARGVQNSGAILSDAGDLTLVANATISAATNAGGSDLTLGTAGTVPPRLASFTTAQRDALLPPNAGAILYNSDNHRPEFYDGFAAAWADVCHMNVWATNFWGGSATAGSAMKTGAGTDNIMLGNNAGPLLDNGTGNIFIGSNSGLTSTSPFNNVVIGTNSASSLTGGMANILIGSNICPNFNRNNCVIIGDSACQNLVNGGNNIIIGGNSGNTLVGGMGNVIIGDSLDVDNNARSSCVMLESVGAGVLPTADSQFVVATGPINSLITDFVVGVAPGGPVAGLPVTINGIAYTIPLC